MPPPKLRPQKKLTMFTNGKRVYKVSNTLMSECIGISLELCLAFRVLFVWNAVLFECLCIVLQHVLVYMMVLMSLKGAAYVGSVH